MLIISDRNEGVWFKHKYRGAEIELKIRPTGVEKIEGIRRKHKRIEYARDPQEKKMARVEVYDEDAIFLDLIDYVLEDFKGIGSAPDKPLEPTRENKKRVLLISASPGEQPLFDFVLERARELEAEAQETLDSEIKN